MKNFGLDDLSLAFSNLNPVVSKSPHFDTNITAYWNEMAELQNLTVQQLLYLSATIMHDLTFVEMNNTQSPVDAVSLYNSAIKRFQLLFPSQFYNTSSVIRQMNDVRWSQLGLTIRNNSNLVDFVEPIDNLLPEYISWFEGNPVHEWMQQCLSVSGKLLTFQNRFRATKIRLDPYKLFSNADVVLSFGPDRFPYG